MFTPLSLTRKQSKPHCVARKVCGRTVECLSERAVAAASSLSDLERSRNLEHEKSLKNESALSEMPLKLRFAEKIARVLV
jgi:hypothetical protein